MNPGRADRRRRHCAPSVADTHPALHHARPVPHAQRAHALDAGVDDVVVDAVDGIDELVARVNACIDAPRERSAEPSRSASSRSTSRNAPSTSTESVWTSRRTSSRSSAYSLRAPNPVNKAELSYALGYRDASQSHTLKQTVMRLRGKLGRASSQIKTVSGFGYRLDADG